MTSSGPGSASSRVSSRKRAPRSGASAAVIRTRFGPVIRRGLRLLQGLGILVARRHRSRGAGEHLVVVDIQQAQPALLAHGERDEAAELDELGLAEMAVEALPESIVGIEMPGDGLGVRERRLLLFGIAARFLEVEKVFHLVLHEARGGGLDRALVAAVVALHRARHVQPAQLLDRVVAYAVAEEVAPGIGERPERRGYVRAHCGAFGPRRAFAPAALHLLEHLRVHLLEREIADSLAAGHGVLLRRLI